MNLTSIHTGNFFFRRLLKRLKDKKKISGALAIAVPSGKYRYTPENGAHLL